MVCASAVRTSRPTAPPEESQNRKGGRRDMEMAPQALLLDQADQAVSKETQLVVAPETALYPTANIYETGLRKEIFFRIAGFFFHHIGVTLVHSQRDSG